MAQTFTITLTDGQWVYAQELATRKDDSDADVTPTIAQWEAWLLRQFWAECKKLGSASALATGSAVEATETTVMTTTLASLGVTE